MRLSKLLQFGAPGGQLFNLYVFCISASVVVGTADFHFKFLLKSEANWSTHVGVVFVISTILSLLSIGSILIRKSSYDLLKANLKTQAMRIVMVILLLALAYALVAAAFSAALFFMDYVQLGISFALPINGFLLGAFGGAWSITSNR